MQPIAKLSLSAEAINAIRDEIVSGKWSVGQRLPNEATLSLMLSVSRGTIREAVRVLVAQGFLETKQGSGTYVRSVTDAAQMLTAARRSSLFDQIEFRCVLEVEAVRLAAIRATPKMIAGLRNLSVHAGNCQDRDKKQFFDCDLAFHRAIIAASGNQAMLEVYEFLSSSIAETIQATLLAELPEPNLRAYASIVDAIEAGNAEKADAAIREFMAPIFSALAKLS